MHYPSVMSVLSQHCSDADRTFVHCIVSTGSPAGNLLTGLLGSIILEKFGWPAVFYFIGKFIIIITLIFDLKVQQHHP